MKIENQVVHVTDSELFRKRFPALDYDHVTPILLFLLLMEIKKKIYNEYTDLVPSYELYYT